MSEIRNPYGGRGGSSDLTETQFGIRAIEDIPERFAELLVKAARDYSAPIFALDLAEGGAIPGHIETMANRWEECDFEPVRFAYELREAAEEIRRVTD